MKYVIIILVFLVSCNSNDFFKDKVLTYKVVAPYSNHIDTLTMKTIPKLFSDKLETSFKYYSGNTSTTFSREGDYTANDKKIKIMSPIGGYLDTTEQLPHPEINLPPKLNDTIFSEHNISSVLPNAGDLISGYQVVTDYIDYSNSGNIFKDSVWVVELHNKENNKYKGKYYFSKEFGFVYFQYVFNNLTIDIELVSLEKYISK